MEYKYSRNEIVEKILSLGNLEIVPIDEEYFKDVPLLPVNIRGTICVCPSDLYEGFFVAKLRLY